jgi:hypothetical protein
MNKAGYVKIMVALVNLLVVIMVEAGRVPLASATKIGENILKAIAGGTSENKK